MPLVLRVVDVEAVGNEVGVLVVLGEDDRLADAVTAGHLLALSHQGYGTLWRLNNVKYGFILKLVQSLGHSIKDLPNPGFPPKAMLKRLEAFKAKQEARKARVRAQRRAEQQVEAARKHDWKRMSAALA